MLKKYLTLAGKLCASLLMLCLSLWGGGALWFQAAPVVAVAWGVASVATLVWWWRRRSARVLLPWALAVALMMGWWSTIQPSHDRVWADDVVRMVTGRVEGNLVTLDQVRNFDWRSDADYTQRWEQRSYDLKQLQSVDVAMSYWMGPAIAHTLVSFGFADGRYLTFSIEIRKERGESFDAIAGFFKRFETVLIAADERDILRVRTNARGEDMYLYRLKMPPEIMRSLFLSYLDEGALLKREPRFYNTLTANCTTIVFEMARRIDPGLPVDWRLLASGYLDRYLYDIGALAGQGGFDSLRQQAHITAKARAADKATDFSDRIRLR
ncbi:Lnb N-terminal periplasmic domain-containing protein [Duganella sp. S19_KUP01_CR8]|uniref:Lnb N-terminal periplasmic domain-containing protein n=1 Tax=Duganella sp. S19_KUP01_CR8 TaxID=3025502 RepID=UPI002FCD8F90